MRFAAVLWSALFCRCEGRDIVRVGFELFTDGGADGDRLISAIESNEYITVTKIEKGRLLCDTLDDAEEAAVLQFTVAADEVVTADRLSFATVGDRAFSNHMQRNIWTGNVRQEGGYPRTITMSWSGCSIGEFQLKITSPSRDGGVDTTVSRPCHHDPGSFFVVHMHTTEKDERPFDRRAPARHAPARHHGSGLRAIRKEEVHLPKVSAVRLAPDTVLEQPNVIDLLVLYTAEAVVDPVSEWANSQMESEIVAAYAEANVGLAASGVDFSIRVVHMQQVDHEGGDGRVSTALYDMYDNERFGSDVHALRDLYGADLVQLVGLYSDACGVAFTMEERSLAFAEFGDECFCAHGLGTMHASKIRSSECDMLCAGDTRSSCGGANALEVFKVDQTQF